LSEHTSALQVQKAAILGFTLAVSACFLVPRNVPFEEIRVANTRVFLKAPFAVEEVFVTLVSDPCAKGNPETDYLAKTSVLSYLVKSGELVLYSNREISRPTKLKWPIEVKTEVTDPYRFSLFEKTDEGKGVRRFIIQRRHDMPVCRY
jgi:hypothetical protein